MRGVRLFNFSRVHVDKGIIDKKLALNTAKTIVSPCCLRALALKKKQKRGREVLTQGKVLIYLFVLALEKLILSSDLQRDPPAICFGSVSPRGPYMVQEITYKLATFVVILYVSLLYLHLVLVYSYQAII